MTTLRELREVAAGAPWATQLLSDALLRACPEIEALIEAVAGARKRTFTTDYTMGDGEPVVGMPDSDYGALLAALEALKAKGIE